MGDIKVHIYFPGKQMEQKKTIRYLYTTHWAHGVAATLNKRQC